MPSIGHSVQGTPSRDRERHPFPQSAHPSPGPSSHQTTSSSTSNSYTHLSLSSSPSPPIQASSQATTVEALLKKHVAAPDPKSAALEHVVNDRNVLAAQNTQLWKLVEKQRTGYNKILKELERIRGERDVYKNRLNTLNGSQNNNSQVNPKDNNYHRRASNSTTTSSSSQLPPATITTPTATASFPSPQPPPQPQILGTDRPQSLSSDSRVSLPEEARQYIANMTESPIPSPQVDGSFPKSKLSASVFPPPPSGRNSEFLDMDDDDDDDGEEDEDEDESEDDNATNEDPGGKVSLPLLCV